MSETGFLGSSASKVRRYDVEIRKYLYDTQPAGQLITDSTRGHTF